MRLCRYEIQGKTSIGFYHGQTVVPLAAAAQATGVTLEAGDSLLPLLTKGERRAAV